MFIGVAEGPLQSVSCLSFYGASCPARENIRYRPAFLSRYRRLFARTEALRPTGRGQHYGSHPPFSGTSVIDAAGNVYVTGADAGAQGAVRSDAAQTQPGGCGTHGNLIRVFYDFRGDI